MVTDTFHMVTLEIIIKNIVSAYIFIELGIIKLFTIFIVKPSYTR